MKFNVSEIFGPTIQGEGIHIGRRTQFIRFAGCDTRCDWCDTKGAWETSKVYTQQQILDRVTPGTAPIITLTGGNPLLQDLGNLVELLFLSFHEVHVETQGTVWKDWLNDVTFASVSPKRHHLKLSVLDRIAAQMHDRCQFKVVIFDNQDITFMEDLYRRYPHIPLIAQVGWPQEQTPEWIADYVAKTTAFGKNVRVLPQLHKYFWGTREGV